MCGGNSIYLSQSENMAEVNVWAIMVGASSAFIYLPGLTVVQRWFPERRGLVAACVALAIGIRDTYILTIETGKEFGF
jgi:OFA family oxalate/formate antiporter-like MFS transporter